MVHAFRPVAAALLLGSLAFPPPARAQTGPQVAREAGLVSEWSSALVRRLAALGRAADPLAPYRLLVGDWAGTLTYTDYRDDRARVELGVRITVAEARDSTGAPALRLAYRYTEPDGRAVEGGTGLLVPGPDPARLSFGGSTWAVVARETAGGALRLVVSQESEDNDRRATVRETLTADGTSWTLVKEVRYAGTGAFFERHTYALRRAE